MLKLGTSLLLVLSGLAALVHGQQGATCSKLNPCLEGCCSQYGSCGFGDTYCGDGCQNNCNAKAQCGEGGNSTTCPLGVCCSPYGFCGTTSDFCGAGCQNGCEPVVAPSCSSTTDTTTLERVIGYYELFQFSRPCDTMQPENIPAGALTHINLAFIEFDDTWNLVDVGGDIVARVSRLKMTYPGLRVNVAIGGWNFNDPPTSDYFSQMAASYENRQTFINSVISYLQKYGLDGIDIDWEYPTATDRGGAPEDTDNFVLLVSDLREAFDQVNPGWEITCTLPSSYWYLQNFNLQSMEKFVSWFNFMSYDLHGMWDQLNKFTGAYLRGHTNLTEIDEGFDLLWRNGIDPKNVVMGMGFYGRSFTMSDPSCSTADCGFSDPGVAGDCSQTAGILYYAEIEASNNSLNVETFYDPVTTVKYNVFNGNQWVSYDDAESWQDKIKYLTSKCLSGLMIWAIDQDDGQYSALTALLGDEAMAGALLQGGDLSDSQKAGLASDFAAYTGQNCFVTEVCTDGSSGQQGPDQICPGGTSSVATAHSPLQQAGRTIKGSCSSGWYRHICCPTTALPKNCQWNGAPVRSEIGCSGFCGSSQFQLNIDTYTDADGISPCYQGQRTLCCDNTEILDQCFWTSCQGPNEQQEAPTCPSGSTFMTYRYDNGEGQLCSDTMGGDVEYWYSQAWCCPNDDVPQNCSWTFSPNTPSDQITLYNPDKLCNPSLCDPTQVQYTTALDPPDDLIGPVGSLGSTDCSAYPPPAGGNPNWPYCCNPPEAYNEKWPVDPSYLWENYYDESGDDVEWSYVDNFGNNNHQTSPGNGDGSDPYGFVMLDGPPGSIDSSFSTTFEVVRRSEDIPNVKRSLITRNRTLIDTTFDHAEEVIFVFCKYPTGSPKCQKLFYKGAEDTIIHLPDHVGEGPYARVVSIQQADDSFHLPYHHRVKREAQANTNPVYRIKIDYDFQAIKRDDGPINMRVDYTNLLDYWKDVTDTPATRKVKKRSVNDESLTYRDWRRKVKTAKTSHEALRKRQADIMTSKTSFAEESADHLTHSTPSAKVNKRWFGAFVDWLKRLNTIESSNVGYLSQFWTGSILLYRAFAGCAKTNAQLSVYLDSEIAMESTYAYYLSGTLVPPSLDGTYAYFGIQPSVYLGVTVQGSARLQYTSKRQPLIPTISYPGLAIKGIAAVGPTLDVFGQIIGVVQISGTMSVGARYTFDKAEVYWPQDSDSADYSKINDLIGNPDPVESGIEPQFQASVQASADLDILVTPEAHIGITVGGANFIGGVTLVDAQLVGYVNSTLRFHADASGIVSGGSAAYAYNYGVYLLYNLGYGGHATIPFYNWYMSPQNLFPTPKQITLYSNGDVGSTTTPDTGTRRSLPAAGDDRGILNRDGDGLELTEPRTAVLGESRIVGLDHGVLWGSEPEVVDITNSSKNSNANVLKKRQSTGGISTNNSAQFSLAQSLTCPANNCAAPGSTNPNNLTPCPYTLPDLRYNCQVFSDRQIVGPNGQGTIVPGICSNVQSFLNARTLPTSGLTLTWDPVNNEARRSYSCPDIAGLPYCTRDNVRYSNAIGIPGVGLVSCDEFPIASSEEGGSFFPSLPTSPTPVSATCVPEWQQSIQGNCHKILGLLSTNVNYADDPTANPLWQKWGSGGVNQNPAWFTANTWQRLATYPDVIPNAENIDPLTYGTSRNVGWYQKRNFTLGLANPTSPTDGAAWGTQALASYMVLGVQGTDATQVACAVNIFGQTSIYQLGSYNGYCLYGYRDDVIYGNIPLFSSCTVLFTGPAPTSNSKKRSENGTTTEADDDNNDDESIGEFGGWKIKKIIMKEKPDVIIPAPGFVPEGDFIPYEVVKESN